MVMVRRLEDLVCDWWDSTRSDLTLTANALLMPLHRISRF